MTVFNITGCVRHVLGIKIGLSLSTSQIRILLKESFGVDVSQEKVRYALTKLQKSGEVEKRGVHNYFNFWKKI